MNVFVLSTGRCGSTTFHAACTHITNYTSAHESRCGRLGADRLAYPPDHIEADNRLSWFLGRLDRAYGDDAFYVHLRRDDDAVARSISTRTQPGAILTAYRKGVLYGVPKDVSPYAVSRDYVDTVNSNIELFLRGRPHVMTMHLERAQEDFGRFWDAIGARGDRDAALEEWVVRHNASPAERSESEDAGGPRPPHRAGRLRRFLARVRR